MEVFSKSNNQWLPSKVIELVPDNKMIVQYEMGGVIFKKKVNCKDQDKVRIKSGFGRSNNYVILKLSDQ